MEGTIKPPGPLSNKGNMAENWMRWKKDFMIFLELSNFIDKSQDIKAYLLRNYIGEVGLNVIQKINVADRDNIYALLAKLDTFFNPVNEVEARYNFFTRHKQRNESIEAYITDLKRKAETCNFGKLTDSLIRDKVVADLNDKVLRKKLFEVQNLDLPKLVSMCNEHNVVITQKQQASSEDTKQKKGDSCCWRCKQKHPFNRCPAWNFKCAHCNELHHFNYCCPRNNPSNKKRQETNKCNLPTAPLPSNRDRVYPDLRYVDTPEHSNESYQQNATLPINGQRSTQTANANPNFKEGVAVENSCILS
ncbi:uncharacterized protein LOC114879356 [Osmia bicornis bicornis]|uniref:uncharacterized protein LOC114879356 n=1 Tax=Osmia bicornis bicornis TaxID=1437191 RepID=UPI0010FA517F|nr:uncharacterized protein LOC114879356 [Osmia bicornis bicornis]